MTKSSVLILDLKGNINSRKTDSRIRHGMYAKRLSEVSIDKPLRLCVISSGENFKKDSAENIDFFEIKSSKLNLMGFVLKSLWIAKQENLRVPVIVCGDPWESFLVSKIFSLVYRDNSKIQVQVHGDVSDQKWEENRFKHMIRSKLHNFAFNHADQVRAVSEKIADFVRFKNPNQEIVVTAIPINLEYRRQKSFSNKHDSIKIGFFGRLHKDRGTENFIEFMRKLDSYRSDFSVVIAGNGPEEFRLRSELQALLGLNRVAFHGFLEQPDIWNCLSNLDVYFSLAPSESYGLGLRESVISGVPVISLDSNGARDARKLFGENWIRIVDTSISPQSLSQKIDDSLVQAPYYDAFSIQEALNSDFLYVLIDSWYALAESAEFDK